MSVFNSRRQKQTRHRPMIDRGTQVLDCRALQALLDFQADWASPPCSW